MKKVAFLVSSLFAIGANASVLTFDDIYLNSGHYNNIAEGNQTNYAGLNWDSSVSHI
jgi:hypothetical protein